MATFTLVTNRRSRRPNRGYSRSQVRPQQTMPTTRDEFRRQFPTHHDAENHYAGTAAAAAPQGSWGRKLRVNANAPQNFAVRRPQKSTSSPTVSPASQVNQRACAYCKEDGHHIRHCEKAAAATAKKQEWKRREKARRAEEKKALAEERLRKQILAAQEAKLLAQQPAVEEESDSESDCEDEDVQTVDNSDQIADLEKQIEVKKAEMKGGSWADVADIEDEIDDLEEELAVLRAN